MVRRWVAMVMLAAVFLSFQTSLAEAPEEAPKTPQALDISLQEFLETYNALPTVNWPLAQQADLEQQVFGLVSLQAGEHMDVYVQLSYNEKKDAVQFAGVVTQRDDERVDLEAFLLVCDHLMEIVFTDMDQDARQLMLMRCILEGAADESYFPDGTKEYSEGDNTITYVVREDGERHVIVYRRG